MQVVPNASPQSSQAGSLRLLLLKRLFPAMLALLLAGAATAYWIALRSSTLAYDRSLLDITLAISEQIHIDSRQPELQLSSQAHAILLTDRFDRIFFSVYGPRGERIAGNAELPLPTSPRSMTPREEGRQYYDANHAGQPVRIAALYWQHEGINLTILAAETLVKRNALVREILIGMLLPELLLIAATLTLVWYGVLTGLTPLQALRQELAGRSHTDMSPITTPVPDEIRPVVAEINDLLVRLEKALASQKHFISNAAHQLRTPIAALQAQFESNVREFPQVFQERLQGTLSATRRLSHLVDQLLALARAEFTPNHPLPDVRLDEMVAGCADFWLPQAVRKDIDLGFELHAATAKGNTLLLQELLGNLVSNALRHTPAGGAITISCGTTVAGGAWLKVEDSGPGIPVSERKKVFERFYQPAGSHSDGCGLGLAIVEEIAKQHRANLEIGASETLGGASVYVGFSA